jgi:hypothetical protein
VWRQAPAAPQQVVTLVHGAGNALKAIVAHLAVWLERVDVFVCAGTV